MKLNTKYFLVFLSSVFVLSACIKNDVKKLGDSGTPRVSFQEAPYRLQYISTFTGEKIMDLFTMIRDEVSSSAANQSYTITITTNSDSLDNYNTANGTDFEPLNESAFSVVTGLGIESQGSGKYKVTFAPGVTNIPFSIKINSATWNFSAKNGLYFILSDPNGKEIKSGKQEIMTAIGVKNKYDGVYSLTGHHNRVPYNFQYQAEMQLITVGPDKVAFYWPDAGSYGHPIGTGPDPVNDVSWYGSAISPVLTFDLATNNVIDAYNIGGATPISLYTATDGADALSNLYNPATKTIYVSWKYNNNPARGFFDTLVYKKSR